MNLDFKTHSLDNTPYFSLNNFNTFARLVDLHDGDTLTCILPLFNNYYKFKIRLNGIDTCEITSENNELKHKALLARLKVLQLLCSKCNLDLNCSKKDIQQFLSQNVYLVWLKCYDFDKYGRLLADIYTSPNDTYSISTILIESHLAYSYTGKTKLNDDEQLNI